MKIGVDYYPENCNSDMWKKDAELMSKTGVKMVRIGEFIWNCLEPKESEYKFEWLDEVIDIFSGYGLEIVLCTPTNCPPFWMYENYPEIVQVDKNGGKIEEDVKNNLCINSPIYRGFVVKIVSQLAKRYANNKFIKVWQIGNELELSKCCCTYCKDNFVKWLQDKYDTIENVNKAFGNNICICEYSDWDEIKPPFAYKKDWQNPSLLLDFNRFSSESTVDFIHLQASIIKKENPKLQVTTNVCLDENILDLYKEFDNLDFVSYNHYLDVKVPENKDEFYSQNFNFDLIRGIKKKDFWTMEKFDGEKNGLSKMQPTPQPNMIKGYALQAFAHGSDTVIGCRWRTATSGAKMYCQGIIDHSNVIGRKFFEFAELCKTAQKLEVMKNTYIDSDIAILYSPEDEWALKMQPQTDGFYYTEQLRLFYSAFSKYGANIDIISSKTDLSKYSIVVAPSLYINNKEATENIYRYVIGGGTLIMTSRSGVKDSNNNFTLELCPTVFRELIGAEVIECDATGHREQTIEDYTGTEYKCSQWCDILKTTTARTYAKYSSNFYNCCPAITVNEYCKGTAYYFGTTLKSEFYQDFAKKIMKQHEIPRLMGMPEGVEITTRTNGTNDFIMFFNNSEKSCVIDFPKAMYSILDSIGKERIELKPFEMDIIKR